MGVPCNALDWEGGGHFMNSNSSSKFPPLTPLPPDRVYLGSFFFLVSETFHFTRSDGRWLCLFCCYHPRVLSANRVDFKLFVSSIFQFYSLVCEGCSVPLRQYSSLKFPSFYRRPPPHRPDRVTYALQGFIESTLGPEFVTPPNEVPGGT